MFGIFKLNGNILVASSWSLMTFLYLASKSPRRRELLTQIGVSFEVLDVNADESQLDGESPFVYVQRVALAKARAGREKAADTRTVLAADTAVVLDGHVLGKPAGRNEAIDMLRRLSGRSHEVFTAVALVYDREQVTVNRSRLCFRPLTETECAAYCDTDEPYDKAGGYAIQGRGATFITRLEGSYSGVMGLPLYETSQLLSFLGAPVASGKA